MTSKENGLKEGGVDAKERQGAEQESLFEMRRLALGKAFGLAVGRDAYDEPAEVERLVQELAGVRKEQLALLDAAIEARKETSSKSDVETDSSKADFGELALRALGWQPKEHSLAESARMTALQKSLYAKEGALLFQLAHGSGIVRMLSEANEFDRLALMVGRQLSRQQLGFGETLDNLVGGYSISASVGQDGLVAFKVGGEKSLDASSTSTHIVIGEAPAIFTRLIAGKAKAAFFPVLQLTPKPDFGGEEIAALLAKPLGLKRAAREPARREVVNPVEVKSGRRSFERWSEMSLPFLENAKEELGRLIADAEAGEFVFDLLANAVEVSSQNIFHHERASPFYEKLRNVLSQKMSELSAKAEDVAAQDRQERAVAWFDGISGERSAELVSKVWGRKAAHARSFSEVELVASNARTIWQSMEGQEALGLFSVRAAKGLGLGLSGRDLPARAKAVLKSQHGLSEGGWRLLGKLPSDGDGPVAEWAFLIGGEPIDEKRGFEAMAWSPRVRSVDFEPNPFESQPAYEQSASSAAEEACSKMEAAKEGRRRRWNDSKSLFCSAMSACSASGADAEKTQELMGQVAFHKEELLDRFFNEPKPPSASWIPAADVEAEAKAFHEKAPILLAKVFAQILNQDMEAGWGSFSQIADWLQNAEWGVWRELPASVSWGDVNSRQKAWHEMILRRERSEKELVAWESLTGVEVDKQLGLASIPLTDGGMLWDEGKAMHHCVSSYAERCAKGSTRIFSILKDGERLGTLELTCIGAGEWRRGQLNGKCNKIINDERALEFADKIVASYQKAHDENLSVKPSAPSAIKDLAGKLALLREDPLVGNRAGPLPI